MFYKTYLEENMKQAHTVDEMVQAFEEMCSHRNTVVDDFLFVESGNTEHGGKTEFRVSLVRQYRNNVFADAFTQTRLDMYFPQQVINFKNRRKLKVHFTSDKFLGSFSRFFQYLRKSALFHFLEENNLQATGYEIAEYELW